MSTTLSGAPRNPGRREVIALGLGAFVVASIPLARRRPARVVRRTLPVMGTIAEVLVVHNDARRAEAAIDAAFAALKDVETRMTRFRADSEIGRVNAAAHLTPVAVSAGTMMVVDAALRWARASEGAFDPAIGRVVELWDVTRRHEPPAEGSVHRLAARQFYRKVEVGMDRRTPSVFFTDEDVRLDLGAIAKGYGIDRAMDALRGAGIAHGLIDVGGEIAAVGGASNGEPWRVGIAAPDDAREVRRMVELTDGAIATSGDYEQFFRWRGRRYHHLMDPGTAAPRVTSMHSVTISAATCMDADAAATAVYGMERTAAQRLLDGCAPGTNVMDVA